MKVNIRDRKLDYTELSKLSEHEKKVILFFKNSTRLEFYRSDLILLKLMLKTATPEQICSIIQTALRNKKKAEIEGKASNFVDFKYLYTWVIQMNLRKLKKG